MKLSIVTSLYLSSNHLREFYKRIRAAADEITEHYEIIFVNDGSPDDSMQVALEIYKADDKVKILDLSRNFAHHKAIMTGLEYTKGELVFLIDCDLEEDPNLLLEFHRALAEEDNLDVVYGVQKARKGPLFERVAGAIFYRLINFISDVKIPVNVSTVRLMKRAYVDQLVKHKDREMFLIGLWVLTGFEQKGISFTKGANNTSSYTIRKKVADLVNAVTSFSNKPLYSIFYCGSVILFLSTVYIVYLSYLTLVLKLPPAGFASIVVSIWFLGGLIMFSIGVLGIYLAKIFIETKKWPYTIVKAIYDRDKNSQT